MRNLLWIPIISLFASSVLDKITTLEGLSLGFVETNPLQAFVLSHYPWFFYTSAFLTPMIISVIMVRTIRFFDGTHLRLHRSVLASSFFAISIFSWTPVVSNLLLLRSAS